MLPSCSSFYDFVLKTKAPSKEELDSNPFEAALYPVIDPLFPRTEGFTEEQTQELMRTVRVRGAPPTSSTPFCSCSTGCACASKPH